MLETLPIHTHTQRNTILYIDTFSCTKIPIIITSVVFLKCWLTTTVHTHPVVIHLHLNNVTKKQRLSNIYYANVKSC